jgi:hypothetical protein
LPKDPIESEKIKQNKTILKNPLHMTIQTKNKFEMDQRKTKFSLHTTSNHLYFAFQQLNQNKRRRKIK